MPVAKSSGGDFTPVPAGTHVARCFGVVSLGTQHSPMFPDSFKVQLMFEIPGETVTIDGKEAPMVISKEYTLSLSEKANLRKDLVSWRGREFTDKELDGFEVSNVAGATCMLSVIHKQSAKKTTYANIASISALPKGVQCPLLFHKLVKFEIEMGANDVFRSLPEWVQKKIQACEEWQRPGNPQGSIESEADDHAGPGPDEGTSVPF